MCKPEKTLRRPLSLWQNPLLPLPSQAISYVTRIITIEIFKFDSTVSMERLKVLELDPPLWMDYRAHASTENPMQSFGPMKSELQGCFMRHSAIESPLTYWYQGQAHTIMLAVLNVGKYSYLTTTGLTVDAGQTSRALQKNSHAALV